MENVESSAFGESLSVVHGSWVGNVGIESGQQLSLFLHEPGNDRLPHR
jgi:hypothetical protein